MQEERQPPLAGVVEAVLLVRSGTIAAVKANQDWVKIHAVIEVDELFVLNYCLTESNVHESQMFADVWDKMPQNVQVKRSLADSAYHGEASLAAAPWHQEERSELLEAGDAVSKNGLVLAALAEPRCRAARQTKSC